MFDFRVMIVLAMCLTWSQCKLDNYCSICSDHTMCKFHGIGKDCKDAGGSGVTEQEIAEILDTHNWLRRIVASGYETRGIGHAQPKAANLRKLTWDAELAKVAQRWADQCRIEHDTCRKDPRWNVGQNLYWKWKYPTHNVNWTEAIFAWYDEVSAYDPEQVEHYRFETSTGHYTQMLWHDTFAIGCGRRDYGQNKLYVCNYGPAGNWIGEPMYTIGEPCSKCPQGTVCDEYLCAVQSKKSETPTKSLVKNNFTGTPEAAPGRNESKYSEGGKTKPSKKTNAVEDEQKLKSNDVLINGEKEQKQGRNPIDENQITFDADTKKGIEEIKFRIEELLKNVIRKQKTKQ